MAVSTSRQRTRWAAHPGRYETRRAALAVDTLVFLVAILPLLLTRHLPLVDLPNHLAGQFIIAHWQTSAAYQQYYQVHWALIPNLGLDVFVQAVGPIIGIDTAFRAFCISTMALLFLGTKLINLHYAGPDARIYRIAPIFFYNGPFQFGFLSFTFGVGLALVAFGLYLRFWNPTRPRRIAAFTLLSSLVFFCHLAAFGTFAIAVCAHQLAEALPILRRATPIAFLRNLAGRAALALLVLLPPLLLFLVLGLINGHPASHYVHYGPVIQKLESVAALTMFSSPGPELGLLALTALGLALAFAVGTIRLDMRGLPFLLLAGLAVLVTPRTAMGATWIDYRLPSAAVFFALGMLVRGPAAPRTGMVWNLWFGVLIVARVAIIATLWLRWEPIFDQFESAFAQLPIGARLMVVEGTTGSTSADRRPSLDNVAALAVARRQGFEPQIFAGFSGQLLRYQPNYQPLWTLTLPASIAQIDPAYNFLLVLRPKLAAIAPALQQHLTPLASGTDFALFRIAPQP